MVRSQCVSPSLGLLPTHIDDLDCNPDDRVGRQRQADVVAALGMAGVVGHGEEQGRDHGPAQAAPIQGNQIGGEDPRQPTEHGDQVEVAQVDEEGVAELEGQRAEDRCRSADRASIDSHGAQQHIHPQSGPIEMADGEPLHGLIGKRRIGEKEQQVGRIEETGLNVADEGGAAVEVRIPERQRPLAELGCGKAVGRIEKGDQIAAVGRLEDIAGDGAPEEGDGEQEQDAAGQDIAGYPTCARISPLDSYPPGQNQRPEQPQIPAKMPTSLFDSQR